MSATNFTPIQLYRTTTASATPSAGNLADGELAINLTDEKLYFKNASGLVKLLASSAGASGTVTSVSGTGTVNGLTLTGTVTSSGSLTLGGTLSVDLSTATVTGTLPVTKGGTGTATQFTAGSVVFAGSSGVYTQDNANLFWDDANNRLGIKTATPTAELDVNGTINVPNQLNYDYTTSVLPDIAPALNLNFVQSNVVDPRITFTRSSTATFVGSNGLIQTAAANTPRLDYDPVTRAPKGLLIEEQRTNLFTYSEQFNNAAWITSSCTVTANVGVAPDGTTTADQIAAAGTQSGIYRFVTVVNGGSYTVSVYVKYVSGSTNFKFGAENSPAAGVTIFNISAGTVVSNGADVIASSITSVGNGWYRCAVTFVATSTSTGFVYYASGSAATWLQWGAQLEAGSFATSYIPTVASQVTRTADVATITGANFSQWYNQAAGTFVVEASSFSSPSASLLYWAASANDGTANNTINIFAFNNKWGGSVAVDGVAQADLHQTGSYTAGTTAKTAIAYAANNFAASVNGAAALTDTAGSIPTVNRLNLGSIAGVFYLSGHIRSIQYYNTRLANTVLQGITA